MQFLQSGTRHARVKEYGLYTAWIFSPRIGCEVIRQTAPSRTFECIGDFIIQPFDVGWGYPQSRGLMQRHAGIGIKVFHAVPQKLPGNSIAKLKVLFRRVRFTHHFRWCVEHTLCDYYRFRN